MSESKKVTEGYFFRWFNPILLCLFLVQYRELIIQFTKREVLSRYRGSILGVFWSFINPLIMLTVYTFVFSVVFKAKWGQMTSGSQFEFALILFSGVIIFNVFSETVSRAPSLITGNVNYVKKVIFPLEILPLTILLSSLIHAVISFIILLVFIFIIMNNYSLTLLLVPVLLLPLLMLTLGLSWFFAALGVYIRDIGYTIGLAINVLFFVTPIFYPVSAVPEFLRAFMYMNPLTIIVENLRKVLLWGQSPDWELFLIITIVSYFVMVLGFMWFRKTRKGFADVL